MKETLNKVTEIFEETLVELELDTYWVNTFKRNVLEIYETCHGNSVEFKNWNNWVPFNIKHCILGHLLSTCKEGGAVYELYKANNKLIKQPAAFSFMPETYVFSEEDSTDIYMIADSLANIVETQTLEQCFSPEEALVYRVVNSWQ